MSVGIRKSARPNRLSRKVLGASLLVIALLGGSFTAAYAASIALPEGTIGIGDVKSKPVADTLKVEDKLVVDETATTPLVLLTPATKVPAPVVVEPAPVVVSAPAAPKALKAAAALAAPAAPSAPVVSTDGWSTARASWYGPGFYGNSTASGKILEPSSMFVAHRTLAFGTRIEFTYNGATAVGVVEDRGPFSGGREFDLGPGLASSLGFGGVDNVSYRIL